MVIRIHTLYDCGNVTNYNTLQSTTAINNNNPAQCFYLDFTCLSSKKRGREHYVL